MLIRGRASACAETSPDTTAPAIVESTASWVRRTGRIVFEVLARDDDVLATAAIEIQAGSGAIEFLPLAVGEHVVDGKGGARTGFRGESRPLAAGATVIYRVLVSDATGNGTAAEWRKLVLGAGEKKEQKASVSGPEIVIIFGIACVVLLCLRLVLRNDQHIEPPPLHPDDEG